MTAISTPAAPATALAPSRRARLALAVILPIGPLAIAGVRALLPYYTTDSNTTMAARIAAHQGAETVVIWLTLVGLLTLIPGVIATGMIARRHSPVLGTIGLCVAYVSFAFLFWSAVAGSDNVALAAARIGLHPAVTGALLTSMGAIAPVGLATALFAPGHILGLLILAVALWRGRVIPAWAAVLLGGSQILHFVFAVIVPNHILDGCAWVLTAVAFAMVARALVRELEATSVS
jgi:hypothetical protein